MDYGETLEEAAVREAKEETNLDVELIAQLGAYSEPDRDPRQHSISFVFIARAKGTPEPRDDASDAGVFNMTSLPKTMAFDHRKILSDYFKRCSSQEG